MAKITTTLAGVSTKLYKREIVALIRAAFLLEQFAVREGAPACFSRAATAIRTILSYHSSDDFPAALMAKGKEFMAAQETLTPVLNLLATHQPLVGTYSEAAKAMQECGWYLKDLQEPPDDDAGDNGHDASDTGDTAGAEQPGAPDAGSEAIPADTAPDGPAVDSEPAGASGDADGERVADQRGVSVPADDEDGGRAQLF